MSEKNKVGRPRNIKDPDELNDLFERYRQDVKANPRYKNELTRDGIVAVPLEAPLTLVGFYNYCRRRVGEVYQYFEQPDVYSEFLGICRAIREEIQDDQISGGMVNIYNPSITQRLNGLVDKQENKVEVREFPSPIIEIPNE
jgi:hypothetical protein